MIVRMKEILLFTLSSSVDETIQKLGELGVLDINKINHTVNEVVERRLEAVNRTENAIAILENFNIKKKDVSLVDDSSIEPIELVDRILLTPEIEQNCKNKLYELNQQLEWYKIWGEHVDVKDFNFLKEKEIYVRLYQADKSIVKELKENHCIATFQEYNNKVPVALFTTDVTERLDLKEEILPKLSLEVIKEQLKEAEQQLEETTLFLESQVGNVSLLEDYLVELEERLGVQQTLNGMGNIDGKLSYLKGYLPKDAVEDFKSVAKKNNSWL